MADEGERVRGILSRDKKNLTFKAGDLYFNGKGKERAFKITGTVVTVQANDDPLVTFETTMHHEMFSKLEYSLAGPYGKTMKFSDDITKMPTMNLTPEIATSPDFNGKKIQLTVKDLKTPFKIGEKRLLSLACLTGDPAMSDYVFAIKNTSFKKPMIVTLIYANKEGVITGREFKLTDWSDELAFAGHITIPDDAKPGSATLVMNFSEMDDSRPGSSRAMYKHFTQLVYGGAGYTTQDGKQMTAQGWTQEIKLIK